jgi:hypothetical protein
MAVGGWCQVREWGGGGSWAEDVLGVFSRYRKIKKLNKLTFFHVVSWVWWVQFLMAVASIILPGV